MALQIAKTPKGNCAACGVLIDAGDWHDSNTCVECLRKGRKPQPTPSVAPVGSLFSDPERAYFESAKNELGARVLDFKGATYNAKRDKFRLTGQALRIFRFMREQDYVSLKEIETATGDPQASISARIRSFKEAGHDYDKRLRAGTSGTWEYKLHINPRISIVIDEGTTKTNAA